MIWRGALLGTLLILLSAGGYLGQAVKQEEREQLTTAGTRPLSMDVEWVLQGNTIAFTGFFCELLGISKGLRALFPQLRVGKSSFLTAFNEPHFGGKEPTMRKIRDFFETNLLPEESDDLEVLVMPSQYSATGAGLDTSVAQGEADDQGLLSLSPSPSQTSSALDTQQQEAAAAAAAAADAACLSLSAAEHGVEFQAGDLSKRYAPAGHRSAAACCRACAAHALCVSWTYGPEFLGEFASLIGPAAEHLYKCSLKGSTPPPPPPAAPSLSESEPPRPPLVTGKLIAPNAIFRAAGRGREEFVSGRAAVPSRRQTPRAIVFHGTMCVYRNESVHTMARDIHTILVGRYMVERPRFPGGFTQDEYLVFSCSARMDEIWVPTQWHKDVFLRQMDSMGIPARGRVVVVPEAVDTRLFDPARVRTAEQGNKFPVGRSREPEAGCRIAASSAVVCPTTASSAGAGDEQARAERRRFRFLSVFKWERRKGWDVLLRAYWSAFTPQDDVELVLRTYMPSFYGLHANISQHIEDFALLAFNTSAAGMARVVWETGGDIDKRSDSLSRADVRDLLGSVDCFVLPTRGEGWGLPIAEAMSMRLPTIVTNYSGPAAYASADNAYLLPVLEGLDDMAFAQPDEAELRRLLRLVVHESGPDGGGKAQQRGVAARRRMQEISPEYVAGLMAERLRREAATRGFQL